MKSILDGIWTWIRAQLLDLVLDNLYVVGMAIFALIRAMGITVKSGNTGLMFSLGRARKVVEPGFQFLVPFLQKVVTLPTRSRTIDLPAQRVTTDDSLVYHVDVNLVYRIRDVRKAIVEVDDLDRAMLTMLGLAVQELIQRVDRKDLRDSSLLDAELERRMEERLARWGVKVERTGFTSIRPSPRTLRITQLGERLASRRHALGQFETWGVDQGTALALLGSFPRAARRAERAGRREVEARERSRVRRRNRRFWRDHATTPAAIRRRVEQRFRQLARGRAGLPSVRDDRAPVPTEEAPRSPLKNP